MAIVEVVKYNGGPDVLAWKYPSEQLSTWTQLIVNESQQAVLYKDGRALDVFKSGKYILDTENIPILSRIINLPFGGRSPFAAEVWFVNKAYNLDIKWGTPTPIQIQDTKYGVFVPVRSNGAFGIQIDDTKKFLLKLVGTLWTFRKEDVVRYFRGLYVTKVKDSISSYLIHKQISVLEINAYIDELSEYMKQRILPEMEEYGIQLVSFYVNDISMSEDDPAVKQLKNALSKKAEMDIVGYDYQQERTFDTLKGAGSIAMPLMGVGMGLSMGHGVINSFQNMVRNFIPTAEKGKECPNCHIPISKGQRFCGNCGYDNNMQSGKETMSAKCSQCGGEITIPNKFCPECGRRINACPQCGNDIAESVAKCSVCGYEMPKKCFNCGADVPKNIKFCPECGTPVAKSNKS